jgi:predicted ABC-type ATPase
VIQAAQRATEIREHCLEHGRSLAFETVLSAPDKLDFIRRAREAGFFIRLFFVGTDDPSINAKRVAMRVMEGGHDVPIPKIIARYTRSLAYCYFVAWLADRTYLYDNSIDDMPAPGCCFAPRKVASSRPTARSTPGPGRSRKGCCRSCRMTRQRRQLVRPALPEKRAILSW